MDPITWKILTHPNPKLREISEEFDIKQITTPEFQAFADEFCAFMIKEDGVGLAAPQIGFQKRIIAVQEKDAVHIYINPEISKKSDAKQKGQEGCLSVPGKYGTVERAKRIRFRAYNRHGRKVEFDASGFQAIVYQHEIDHLDGILFIDKIVGSQESEVGSI